MSKPEKKRTKVEDVYGPHATVDEVDRGAGVARIALPDGSALNTHELGGLREGQGGDPHLAAITDALRRQMAAGDDGKNIKLGDPSLTDIVAALRMAGKR